MIIHSASFQVQFCFPLFIAIILDIFKHLILFTNDYVAGKVLLIFQHLTSLNHLNSCSLNFILINLKHPNAS